MNFHMRVFFSMSALGWSSFCKPLCCNQLKLAEVAVVQQCYGKGLGFGGFRVHARMQQ